MLNIIHEQVEKLCFPEFICWKNFRLWPKICYITSRIILSSMNLKKKKTKKNTYSIIWLKLKLQYFGHLMRRVDSLEKTLTLGGIWGRRRRGRQRMRWLDGITDLMDVSLSELREMVMNREAWRAVIHGVSKSQTRLSNWTELNWKY